MKGERGVRGGVVVGGWDIIKNIIGGGSKYVGMSCMEIPVPVVCVCVYMCVTEC